MDKEEMWEMFKRLYYALFHNNDLMIKLSIFDGDNKLKKILLNNPDIFFFEDKNNIKPEFFMNIEMYESDIILYDDYIKNKENETEITEELIKKSKKDEVDKIDSEKENKSTSLYI